MTITKIHAVADTVDASRVRSLPARLDAEATISVLNSIGAPVEIAASTGQYLDINDVDAALAKTKLSIDDKIRLKYSLVQHGFIPRGRPAGMARI
jgi:hypothetical protein